MLEIENQNSKGATPPVIAYSSKPPATSVAKPRPPPSRRRQPPMAPPSAANPRHLRQTLRMSIVADHHRHSRLCRGLLVASTTHYCAATLLPRHPLIALKTLV